MKSNATFRWLGLGEGLRSDHMVWRHTCSTIDFEVRLAGWRVSLCLQAGRVTLTENGKKLFDKSDLKVMCKILYIHHRDMIATLSILRMSKKRTRPTRSR